MSITLTSRTINFFVPGKPAPQGSKRHVGNGRMIESSREVGPWRERVALVAQQGMDASAAVNARNPCAEPLGMFSGAVRVRLDFILPRPKSTPKRSTPPAVKRPDVDKLVRACLDALTNVIITDDSLVVDLSSRKRLAEIGETPGVHIEVSSDVETWR